MPDADEAAHPGWNAKRPDLPKATELRRGPPTLKTFVWPTRMRQAGITRKQKPTPQRMCVPRLGTQN
jgi:hypothetical protein